MCSSSAMSGKELLSSQERKLHSLAQGSICLFKSTVYNGTPETMDAALQKTGNHESCVYLEVLSEKRRLRVVVASPSLAEMWRNTINRVIVSLEWWCKQLPVFLPWRHEAIESPLAVVISPSNKSQSWHGLCTIYYLALFSGLEDNVASKIFFFHNAEVVCKSDQQKIVLEIDASTRLEICFRSALKGQFKSWTEMLQQACAFSRQAHMLDETVGMTLEDVPIGDCGDLENVGGEHDLDSLDSQSDSSSLSTSIRGKVRVMDVSGDGGTSVHVLELSQEVMGRQVPLFGVPPGDGDIQSPISQPTLQELEELAEKQFGAVDLMGGSGPHSNLASLDEPSDGRSAAGNFLASASRGQSGGYSVDSGPIPLPKVNFSSLEDGGWSNGDFSPVNVAQNGASSALSGSTFTAGPRNRSAQPSAPAVVVSPSGGSKPLSLLASPPPSSATGSAGGSFVAGPPQQPSPISPAPPPPGEGQSTPSRPAKNTLSTLPFSSPISGSPQQPSPASVPAASPTSVARVLPSTGAPVSKLRPYGGDRDALKKDAQVDEDTCVRNMVNGHLFKAKHARMGKPQPCQVSLHEDGDVLLYGKPTDKRSKLSRLAVSKFQGVSYGLQAGAFEKKSVANKVEPDVCFSLLFDKKVLCLECQNREERDLWAKTFESLKSVASGSLPVKGVARTFGASSSSSSSSTPAKPSPAKSDFGVFDI